MGRNADLRHEVENEGLGGIRTVQEAPQEPEETNWRPLLAAVVGILFTLTILVVGLAPTWAVITAVSVIAIVLAAVVALAWGITHVRRPTH